MSSAASTFGAAHFVSVSRAAKVLGLSERSLQRYAADGTMPAKRVGERGRWLVPVSWLRPAK